MQKASSDVDRHLVHDDISLRGAACCRLRFLLRLALNLSGLGDGGCMKLVVSAVCSSRGSVDS
jgi:hypothetical protein